MIALSRARPVSINIFAVSFLTAALLPYIDGLLDLAPHQAFFETFAPQVAWSRDWVIVMLSARLSIALIPIAMVWLSAVRFARWMVTIMVLGKVPGALPKIRALAGEGAFDPSYLAALLLSLLAVAVLFTPASNRWFADKGGVEPAVFE
jgi:hypothetical protein